MSYRKSTCCVFCSPRWAFSGLGLLVAIFVLSGGPTLALQLSPTSTTTSEEKRESLEEHAALPLEASSPDLDFLDSGELPKSLEQIKAMQAKVKSLSEQIKDATVSIRMRGGQGTGVLVSSDGVILTAAHVIGRPRQMALITFRDGSRARAITLGVEAEKDSGMLKVLDMIKEPANDEESASKEEDTDDGAGESDSATDDEGDSDEGAGSDSSDSDDGAADPSESDSDEADPSEAESDDDN